MENSKIILILVMLFSVTFSCKKNDYKYIKNDLYSKNDSLLLLQKNEWHEDKEYVLERFDSEVIYLNKIYQLKQIVDTKTFEKNNRYYYDKNNIYFYNSSPAFFPTLNAIPSKSKELIRYGYDYVSTDNKVFYQSKEIKNADCETFKVSALHKLGVNYAFDKNNFFLKDSIVIEDKILDSLKNDYQKEFYK